MTPIGNEITLFLSCSYDLASARNFDNKWEKSGRELPNEKRLNVCVWIHKHIFL